MLAGLVVKSVDVRFESIVVVPSVKELFAVDVSFKKSTVEKPIGTPGVELQ